ncbi:hypothetical protein D3C77_569980 [compost metagenome]
MIAVQDDLAHHTITAFVRMNAVSLFSKSEVARNFLQQALTRPVQRFFVDAFFEQCFWDLQHDISPQDDGLLRRPCEKGCTTRTHKRCVEFECGSRGRARPGRQQM